VIVTPGRRDDADWTRQLAAAARQVAARRHLRAQLVDGSAAGGIDAALAKAKRDARLVVVPFSADREAAIAFARATKIPTLVWGQPEAVRSGLIGDVQLIASEGLYAAGVVAAHASAFHSVGIVICDDVPPVDVEARYKMAAAFVDGARHERPGVDVSYVRAGEGGAADAAAAKAATLRIALHGTLEHAGPQLAERGAQMILALCGSALPGVMQAIEQAGGERQLVGIVGDKAPINKQNMVLTSAMWNPAPVLEQALKDLEAGEFGETPYPLEFAHDGITLLSTGRTPGDALDAGEATKARFLKEAEPLSILPQQHTEEGLRGYIAITERP
jgi:basic membrane lipoprotein Med (substrate-binding protein (PBP1-ABC) superfamily)